MKRLYTLKWGWALTLYCLLNLLCVGMGMGVPLFNILLGAVVGWYAARRTVLADMGLREILRQVLVYAAVASGITALMMALLWGPMAAVLYDPSADIANTGIPMILFEPKASLIGWLVLMIVISPFLQFLMALFGAHLALLCSPPGAQF